MDWNIFIDVQYERECINMAKHGGDIYTASEILGNPDVMDFSANINPLGVPDSVREAIIQNIDRLKNYPDPKSRKLREAIGEFHGINPDQIVCGNGGADIIFRLVYSICPKKAIIPVPTFSEYGEALEKCGSEVNYFQMSYPFCVNYTLFDELKKGEYDFLVICNPNNPTGSLIDNNLMSEIMNYTKENNIYVLVDECFYDMTDDEMGIYSLISAFGNYPNLIILKSMTKLYAIPGLRLGYGISSDTELVNKIATIGQPWSVNVMAELAGCAALKDYIYRSKSIQYLKTEREYLYNGLKKLGFDVWKPNANYIFFRAEGFNNLDELLLSKNILLRHCDTYKGLSSEYYRAAVKSRVENNYLLHSMKKILTEYKQINKKN